MWNCSCNFGNESCVRKKVPKVSFWECLECESHCKHETILTEDDHVGIRVISPKKGVQQVTVEKCSIGDSGGAPG